MQNIRNSRQGHSAPLSLAMTRQRDGRAWQKRESLDRRTMNSPPRRTGMPLSDHRVTGSQAGRALTVRLPVNPSLSESLQVPASLAGCSRDARAERGAARACHLEGWDVLCNSRAIYHLGYITHHDGHMLG